MTERGTCIEIEMKNLHSHGVKLMKSIQGHMLPEKVMMSSLHS